MKKVKSTLSVGKRIVLLSLCMTMFSVAGFSQGAKGILAGGLSGE